MLLEDLTWLTIMGFESARRADLVAR